MKIAALFDLDGVLIDSESIYTEFWTSMDRLYPTGIKNFPYVIKGTTLPKILDTYFPDPEVQARLRVHLKKQEDEMVYRVFPGATGFLQSLKDAGVPTAIVTSSNVAKMRVLFEALPGFEQYFHTVVTDSNVVRSKPDPEAYLLAARRLGVPPEQCVVFEDSKAGLEAGRRAGGKVVAVATTLTHSDIAGRGDIIVDSLGDMTLERMYNLFNKK